MIALRKGVVVSMASVLKGISVPKRKITYIISPTKLPVPCEVVLPMQMHIGKAAIPVVREGDRVAVGTVVARPDGDLSSYIHSSVSGIVTDVGSFETLDGRVVSAVRIASDGEGRVCCDVAPPRVTCRDDFVDALKQSGIVGLGGAGFPTHVKYSVAPERIKTIIINAAECEPYITSDTHTMVRHGEYVEVAIEAFREYLGVGRIIVGFERDNEMMTASLEALADRCSIIQLKRLSEVYPQGAERVLIYHTTGEVTPVGGLPINAGCIVSNISTVAEIGRYLKHGMPLVERCITVDGGAVRESKNVIVPVGVRLRDVIDYCGGFLSAPAKLLFGGPMMGLSVNSIDMPILKNTNAVLALDSDEAFYTAPSPCIRCGSCLRACPFDIDPAAIARARKRGAIDAVRRLRVDACMECGCCSYVCPAKLPLVESNRMGKAELRQHDAAKRRALGKEGIV